MRDASPGRQQDIFTRRWQTQTGQPPDLEGRDQKGVITGRWFELAGTNQAGESLIGIPTHQIFQGSDGLFGRVRSIAGDVLAGVNVGPGPGLVGGWENVGRVCCVAQPHHGQWPFERHALLELPVLQHHQEKPGTQLGMLGIVNGRTSAVHLYRPGRRVTPGKVLLVELNKGQVVGLEVCHPVARLGADYGAGVDTDHISRPDELDIAGNEVGDANGV